MMSSIHKACIFILALLLYACQSPVENLDQAQPGAEREQSLPLILTGCAALTATPEDKHQLPLESTKVEAEVAHISQVIYTIRPTGGGFNSLEVKADGELTSRYASAQAPQDISQEESQITKDKLDEIWEAAYRLWEHPPKGSFILPENGESYAELTILTYEQRQKSFFWRWDEAHENERVNALAELLAARLSASW